jgi:hypothetical protein
MSKLVKMDIKFILLEDLKTFDLISYPGLSDALLVSEEKLLMMKRETEVKKRRAKIEKITNGFKGNGNDQK